jgi:NADPH-dependent curcumin reductase CurA
VRLCALASRTSFAMQAEGAFIGLFSGNNTGKMVAKLG